MNDIQPGTGVGTVAPPTASGQPAGPAAAPGGAVLGPFTLRDLVIFGSVLVMLVGTVLPIAGAGGSNFWNSSTVYFLVIGIVLPLAVAVMFLVQRLNRSGLIRVGSLSLDQFGSVVASFAAGYFFLLTVGGFSLGYLISLIGALGLLAATVAAKWLPFFGTATVPAPALAALGQSVPGQSVPNPVQEPPVDMVASTFAEPPAAAEPQPFVVGQHFTSLPSEDSAAPEAAADVEPEPDLTGPEAALPFGTEPPEAADPAVEADPVVEAEPAVEAGSAAEPEPAAETATDDSWTRSFEAPAEPATAEELEPESFAATVDPASRPGQDTGGQLVYEAFWFAVDRPKAVLDEHTGGFLYNIEPGTWFLALQDRGHDFIVQNSDGRIGVLRDLSSIERAPEDG